MKDTRLTRHPQYLAHKEGADSAVIVYSLLTKSTRPSTQVHTQTPAHIKVGHLVPTGWVVRLANPPYIVRGTHTMTIY